MTDKTPFEDARVSVVRHRIDDGLAVLFRDGFRMPKLRLADRLESPSYSKLLQLVAMGDEAAVDLATRRFTLEVFYSAEAATRRRAYDFALSLLVDLAIASRRPTAIVLDRGLASPGDSRHRPGGLYLSIDPWQNDHVIASIVTDYADVVPREGLNSALLSLGAWWTIPTAAPHKPIFRKVWKVPHKVEGRLPISSAISLAVVQVLDAIGGHPVALRHTMHGSEILTHLRAPLFVPFDPAADRSIAREIVQIPAKHWKVPAPAEADPRSETETVRAAVADAERQANDADDELSIMALGDVLKHLDERLAYEEELLVWLRDLLQLGGHLRMLTRPVRPHEMDD